ncbi:oleate hydratase [Clostridium bowmanii]|uniref:oleate hydratase n=1 Tax=Clostridium bowmanii TaxID=132925 RepID=UPI001C0B89A8|nr:oleate hydratase [Clostridium bowmanii]MBU3188409.1 oleate hydratase [Clostridium bowmanii]MCA1072797.1 oleate hydratase [Clostridium bowmanii]
MGNYQNINTLKPVGIENKKAYLIGGGIASLAAAAYLIRDGHMDGKNITILEQSHIIGGSMDGSGNAKDGYIVRGGREMEEHYECCWDLFSKIPSLSTPSQTVLDEFRQLNNSDPNESTCRLLHNCGEKADFSSLGLKDSHIKQLTMLFLATEEDLGATTVEQYFDPSFLETNMWCFWRSMFAFENWHSVVEMKRYMQRFMHLLPGMSHMKNIMFPKYNQYESMILPLEKWLLSKNVVINLNSQVTDLDIDIESDKKTVTAIHLLHNDKDETIHTTVNDLVFVTNGSMTENSTIGSMHKPAVTNRGVGGCWNLWKNIAKKDDSFGKPEVFCSDIDKSKWESFTITSTSSKIAELLKKLTGRDPYSGKTVTGGIITMKDSSWLLSLTCNRQPHFSDQPKNVLVIWAYGLFPDNIGDFVKKRMSDCTGEEMMTELLYHLGMKEETSEILKNVNVIPCMMPYTTSQFMPRVKDDRPNVIPKGSTNLAFLGQFAEVEDDCVFTVEYSIRSAMMAVYNLLNLDKKVPEVYPTKYDIRVVAAAAKALYSGRPLPAEAIVRKLLKNTTLEGLI